VDPLDLTGRLRELASVLANMTPEQFRQVTVWLKNISGRKLPEPLRAEVDKVLDETKPQEVTKMISNIERTLDKMQKQSLMYGKAEGKAEGLLEGKAEGLVEGKAEGLLEGKAEGLVEGKADTARAALREGLDVDMICKITGLPRKAVLELKRELEN
jgi:flagellar biosynthesis/type III secretory pathway protein FliH